MQEYISREYVSRDGEIITGDDAYRKAKSELASFKFQLFETANADPRLADTKCVNVLIVISSFMSIDDRTLKPSAPWASNVTLRVKATIKSDSTISRARALLIENGYLIPRGQSRDGSTLYEVANPRLEIVDMHVRESLEFHREREAERKREQRRKQELKRVPTVNGGDKSARVPTVNEGDVPTITVEDTLEDTCKIGYEGKVTLIDAEVVNSYAMKDDADHLPFPIPESDVEGDHMMTEIFHDIELSAGSYRYFRMRLFAGKLTETDLITHKKAFVA